MVGFHGDHNNKPRPMQRLDSPCHLAYDSIIYPSASLRVYIQIDVFTSHLLMPSAAENPPRNHISFPARTCAVIRICPHLAKHYSQFMPVGHPVDTSRECSLSHNPEQNECGSRRSRVWCVNPDHRDNKNSRKWGQLRRQEMTRSQYHP